MPGKEVVTEDVLAAQLDTLRAEMKALRSDMRLLIIGGIAASQALSHVEIPQTVGYAGAALIAGIAAIKVFLAR